MHHLIEISLGQLLLQPPLVCFCCRVFLTMLEKGRWLPHRQKNCPFLSPLCWGPAGSISLLRDFVAKKIPIDTLDRAPEPDEDAYRHA